MMRRRVAGTNVMGTIDVTNAFLPLMEGGRKTVVNLSSGLGSIEVRLLVVAVSSSSSPSRRSHFVVRGGQRLAVTERRQAPHRRLDATHDLLGRIAVTPLALLSRNANS
jgi:hypothetical protein